MKHTHHVFIEKRNTLPTYVYYMKSFTYSFLRAKFTTRIECERLQLEKCGTGTTFLVSNANHFDKEMKKKLDGKRKKYRKLQIFTLN